MNTIFALQTWIVELSLCLKYQWIHVFIVYKCSDKEGQRNTSAIKRNAEWSGGGDCMWELIQRLIKYVQKSKWRASVQLNALSSLSGIFFDVAQLVFACTEWKKNNANHIKYCWIKKTAMTRKEKRKNISTKSGIFHILNTNSNAWCFFVFL